MAEELTSGELTNRQRIGAVVAGSAGNLIEWFDFYVYAFLALYFAPLFFPEGDRTAQLLNVAGIYAIGFLVRPLGGWAFGRYADRSGRRRAIVLSILMMGVGSLLIAIVPTYEQVGVMAPALLLLSRILQGLSTGGQYGTAATYLAEVASDERRGFFASFQFVTLIGGQLLALLALLLLQLTLTDAQISAWGWRIPFAVGAVMAASVIFFRQAMHDSYGEVGLKSPDSGTLSSLAKHPREFMIVLAMTAGGAVTLYTFTTYMQKFLVNTGGMDTRSVSYLMTGAILVFMFVQPVIGNLSDRTGRRLCLLIFSGVMTVSAVPLMTALETPGSAWHAFALVAFALVTLSFYTSISGLFKSELFPPHVRALGVSLAHAIAAAIFGGTAEYFALLAKQYGHERLFYWYVAAVCAVAFFTALMMKEPRREKMME